MGDDSDSTHRFVYTQYMFKHYMRYMIRLLVGPVLIITAALTSIIWLTRALRFVDFIVNRGLSLGDFIYIKSGHTLGWSDFVFGAIGCIVDFSYNCSML